MYQVIHIPTHGPNTLNLLFIDALILISSVSSACGLCDHETIIVKHRLKVSIINKAEFQVPLFQKGKWY